MHKKTSLSRLEQKQWYMAGVNAKKRKTKAKQACMHKLWHLLQLWQARFFYARIQTMYVVVIVLACSCVLQVSAVSGGPAADARGCRTAAAQHRPDQLPLSRIPIAPQWTKPAAWKIFPADKANRLQIAPSRQSNPRATCLQQAKQTAWNGSKSTLQPACKLPRWTKQTADKFFQTDKANCLRIAPRGKSIPLANCS